MTTDIMPSSRRPSVHREAVRTAAAATYLVPLGRFLFALIFLAAVPMHFTAPGIQYAAGEGVPLAGILVPLSGVFALLGGLSVLLGYYARVGAALLAVFLLPVTLVMHDFWSVSDPMAAQLQQVMFMKNLAILGGALLIMYFGSGPFSVGERRRG
jgi:putative oxidoreductase